MSDSVNKPSAFGKIMRDKNSRLMIFGVGGVLVLAFLIVSFSGSGPAPLNSTLRSAPQNLPNAVGGPEVLTPDRVAMQKKVDEENRIKALGNGGSSLPTPIQSTVASPMPSLLPTDVEVPRDPIPKMEPPVDERPISTPVDSVVPTKVNPFAQPVPNQGQSAPPPRTVDPNLVQNMQKQLGAMMTQTIVPAQTTNYNKDKQVAENGTYGASNTRTNTNVSPVSTQGQPTGGSGSGNTQIASNSNGNNGGYGNNQRSRFTPPATGTILYSKLIGRINSDAPGPVIAEVLQGPFSGARLIGSFSASEAGVLIRFNSMSVPYRDDGEEKTDVVPIQAVAVDTQYLGTAIASDIDTHIFTRIASAFATSLLQGLGQAISQSGSTTSTTGLSTQTTNPVYSGRNQLYIAGGVAAGAVGNIIDQTLASKKPTITVDADTPFGLLFLGNQATMN